MSMAAWEMPKGVSMVVGICHRELVYGSMKWAMDFRELQIPTHVYGLSSHQPIDHSRNSISELVFTHNATWLFFMDSDMSMPPDSINRLLARNLPIVSGLYRTRNRPHAPLAMKRVPQPQPDGTSKMVLVPIPSWTPGELLEIDACGAGCLLIHRRVLEAFKKAGRRPFRWTFNVPACPQCGYLPPEGLSEDFQFCTDAEELGFKIFLDTSVVCEHIIPSALNPVTGAVTPLEMP